MLACLGAGRIASVCLARAFLWGEEKSALPLRSLSRADFSRGCAGCTVESESVRAPARGEDESLRAFSLRVRPVFGLSLAGLATDSAYLLVRSSGLPESSASSTEAGCARLELGSGSDIASQTELGVEPRSKCEAGGSAPRGRHEGGVAVWGPGRFMI